MRDRREFESDVPGEIGEAVPGESGRSRREAHCVVADCGSH